MERPVKSKISYHAVKFYIRVEFNGASGAVEDILPCSRILQIRVESNGAARTVKDILPCS
jgi:hypothetical protein